MNYQIGLVCVALLSGSLFTGCASIPVSSIPQGERIILDGNDTRLVTPAKLRIRNMQNGKHTITVAKEGFRTVTPPLEFDIGVRARCVIGSILFPPAILFQLFDNKWKFPDKWQMAIGNPPFQFVKEDSSPLADHPVEPTGVHKQAVQEHPQRPQTTNKSTVERLKELKVLKDAGLISEQEFETKRKLLIEGL